MGRLTGLRIVVTRAAEQAAELEQPLRAAGASVILLPAIAIRPPADLGPLLDAVRRLASYHWLVLTSVNAVEAFVPRIDLRTLSVRPRLAVVGKATLRHAHDLGWTADLVPAEFTAESLAVAFEQHPLPGRRVLFPSGDLARDLLPQRLRALGAQVDVVEAYRTVMPEETARTADTVLGTLSPADWVTVASPSAVDNLIAAAGVAALRPLRFASIGPATSSALRAHGLTVAVEAEEHTMLGLVRAIESATF